MSGKPAVGENARHAGDGFRRGGLGRHEGRLPDHAPGRGARAVPGDGTGISPAQGRDTVLPLTLQRYRVHDAGRRMKTEVPPPCPARGVERKSGKIRFYFRKYFVHIDVPDTLSQYPEVREFVNIKSLLSEADRKLLAETECDEAESLLERIENEGYCHVRARCWTPDEESGGWMCVLSVDV